MVNIKNIDNTDELEDDLILGDDIIELPEELSNAPEKIKESYIEWVKLGRDIDNHPNRFFNFVNPYTGESVQVDLKGLPGKIQADAKAKGISPHELKHLDSLVKEFQNLKIEKTKISWKWRLWAKPRMGSTVFEWRKAEIIEMFTKYMTIDEVKQQLEKEGYTTSTTAIYNFFVKNRETIEKKRVNFIKSTKDHYLATDAGRMETLAMLHNRFVTIFNELYSKQPQTQSLRAEMKAISGEIRGVLEQARKEIKGEELKLTVDGHIDITASINAAKTIQEISKSIPLHLIPVYLVAAKGGVSPHNLLTSLVTSFYKDFNGFSRGITSGKPKLTNDLIRNYNWEEIRLYHEEKQEGVEIPLSTYEDLSYPLSEQVKTKREKLLDMINKPPSDNK